MFEVPSWLIVDVLSLLVIALLLVAYRIRIADRTPQKSYIEYMLAFLALLFAGHTLVGLGGGVHRGLAVAGCVITIGLDAGILVLWQAYCEVWASMNKGGAASRGASPWLWAQRVFLLANVMLVLVGLRPGWFFSFDAAGTYHRGPFFMAHVVATLVSAGLVEAYLVRNRRSISPQAFPWLAAFLAAPLVGGIAQLFVRGLPLEFAGALLSVGLLHVFVQEYDANTDFLTGVANRRQLDLALDARVHAALAGKQPLAGMMVDIDKFKQINDVHGHNQGDAALVELAAVLVHSFRGGDVVARHGGDEFFVASSIGSMEVLAKAEGRVRAGLERLNASGRLGFPLEVSIGAGVFDPALDHDVRGFTTRLDVALYEEKRRKAAELGVGEEDLR